MSESVFRVVIVDSATGNVPLLRLELVIYTTICPLCLGLFRTDFSGRGELAERQQKLGQMMSCLQKMAEEFNIAVIITNQVG